ncbi:hypothetical protein NQZ68_021140 [Dissostichus eleginoides]|nr:hypothetical protein NQZ68_021140 [Dissostichus eleginoides]
MTDCSFLCKWVNLQNLQRIKYLFPPLYVSQEVSELPDTVAETVLLTQEDSRNKSSGQKKKNRERGKGKGNKGRHKRQRQRLTTDEDMQEEEEEFYDGEEYSYEYEEELPTDVLLASQEWKNYTQEELITTHSPAHSETLVETSSHPLTSSTDRDIDAQVILTTSEPLSQPGDIEMEETSLPTPPITTEEQHKDDS